ncbi:hypothetical protein QTH87_19150 [Variovorax sp. J22P168]|uniref:hypothetical protein n=1 Tax=Variovorax jilinensis TaxID=3053513 RepID=UPI00257590AF|nr:hypothetical protein [Variovorax sp. J22P168]MDM0014568.1 hypothetical protein [Variovorax sp. J22P168]
MSCTIRTVDDLAQLPDAELLACFGALRSAIHEARRRHAAALREKRIAADAAFRFASFDWRPRGAQRFSMPANLSPDTPIDEISMRIGAREALKKLSIFCIDDLSAISEQELLQEEAIGAKTVGRLREALTRVGLDFMANVGEPAQVGVDVQIDAGAPASSEGAGSARYAEVRKLLSAQARDLNANESMDWMGLYAYPSQLLRLKPGDTGVFVCPPAWRGRLGTVCGVWIKGNTDWADGFAPGTPWKEIFWTESHVDGLKVVRASPPGRVGPAPVQFLFAPRIASALTDPGLPRLDQVVSLWRTPRAADAGRRADRRLDVAV